ncbi:MAG: translational GTPase TypA [Planctomycetes bacterium]|nr:translational GTPase TypA [Planctomycetota bacterium]
MAPKKNPAVRNIAIIAHVDHGKTTLVDAMFKFAGTFRANQEMQECVMDSDPQERERGITILAKNTAIQYAGTRINVVDTPGHADFGGQVERTLKMADAVLLLVDSHEGPMPQTRFVLRKAFENGLKAMVLINKIDRPDQRAHQVLDEIFDLFVDLGASDEQLDFPVLYGSGRGGFVVKEPEDYTKPGAKLDMQPLFDLILSWVPVPEQDDEAPLQFQAATIDFDDYVGRIGIGRVTRGTVRVGMRVAVCHPDRRTPEFAPIKQLFRYEGLQRVQVDEVHAGDIAIVGGVEELSIGDTLCPPDVQEALPAIKLEEPTISMVFCVNTSPFAGREGQYVTSRQISARLDLAALRDVALQVAPTATPDAFEVKGRGVMHLGVLAENMRREGYELAAAKPHVILKRVDGVLCEPIERASIEVPNESAGKIIEYLGKRRGEMVHMEPFGEHTRLEFLVPSRGLIGARTAMMTLSRGEAILSHVFEKWAPDGGAIPRRVNGALVADRAGKAVPYALFRLLDRGEFFIEPGEEVYEGMIVGENNKDNDLELDVTREKKLTNIRSAGADENVKLPPPHRMSLEEALEYIEDDELVEITPKNLRLRKKYLSEVDRRKQERRERQPQ